MLSFSISKTLACRPIGGATHSPETRHVPDKLPSTKERLPLNPVDFMVLLVLAQRDRHGYALLKEMDRRTDGKISLLPGNLYVVLRRLLRDELIAESDPQPRETHRGRRRRYYRVTRLGRQAAAAETARMKELVEAATAIDLLGEVS